MKTLKDLFLAELADIYDAEQRIVKALPKLAKASVNPNLKAAFEEHLVETDGHIGRLERVFAAFGEQPKPKKCAAMVGLVKEAEEIASDNKGEATLDAALISAAQKVEHYEIATYGCLVEWADLLGNDAAGDLLEKNLGEERAADQALTQLARSRSNIGAMEAEDEPLRERKNDEDSIREEILA